MKAKFVIESLYNDKYYENQLFESVINEKFDMDKIFSIVNNIKDKKQSFINLIKKFNKEKNLNLKKYIGILLIGFYLVGFAAKNNKWTNYHKLDIQKAGIELAQKDNITSEDIKTLASFDVPKNIPAPPVPEILSVNQNIVNDINNVVPKRMSTQKINHYEQYNNSILKAVKNLKAKGENPNADLIKAIMLIETGMTPRKNNLGFEGFPQTKSHIIKEINDNYKQTFTMADMYNAERAAEFIHYYTKNIQKSKYVNNLEDMIMAYNWGLGNLINYKRYNKGEIPQQSKDYMKMIKVLQKYFT